MIAFLLRCALCALAAIMIGVLLALFLGFLLAGCAATPVRHLPSNPAADNMGQGQSVGEAECTAQGRHAYFVDTPDGSGDFFLYCLPKKTEL